MIVPHTRLLFWVAAVILPFSILAVSEPQAMLLSLVAMGAFVLLVAIDGYRCVGRLDGLSVHLPEVSRVSNHRAATLEVQVKNLSQKAQRLRLGIPFPKEFQVPAEEVLLLLPTGAETSRLAWEIYPLRRGKFRVERAYLETASPLGFWSVRTVVPLQAELRVYPNLLTERNSLAALFLNRGHLGMHVQRQLGKGRDFEKLREYIPGDSFEDVHWKATAKRGHPVTKVYQIEKTQELYVVIDASRLSGRTMLTQVQSRSTGAASSGVLPARNEAVQTTVLERFITAGLVLGLAAEQQGDLFGLLTFSDKIGTFIRAKNGQAHYDACRDAIYALQPQTVTPDFNEVASFIRLRLRRRALLIFLTALDDPVLSESFVQHLDLISRQHLILVNMMKPAGADPLFSQASPGSFDDLYRHMGGHMQWHNLRELEKILQRRGVRFCLMEQERMSAQLVSQYLGVKQRQLL